MAPSCLTVKTAHLILAACCFAEAKPVKVYADASLVFPLLVAQTFAKVVERTKEHDTQEQQTESAQAMPAATTDEVPQQ